MAFSMATAGPSRFFLPQQAPILAAAAAAVLPVDSLSPPAAVRSNLYRTAPRALARRTMRRTRRRSLTDDPGDDGFSGDGDGDDGAFGGGGGGGRGFGASGGFNWEGSDPSSSPSPDPAFDFVYEMMCWIALSNCALFAVKKVGRLLSGRGRVVPLRLVQSIC